MRGGAESAGETGAVPLFAFPQEIHINSQIHPQLSGLYSRAKPDMNIQRPQFELWRERDWRCEWWVVSGRPLVRLYLGTHKVNELAAGPNIDLRQQTSEWHKAAHADRHHS